MVPSEKILLPLVVVATIVAMLWLGCRVSGCDPRDRLNHFVDQAFSQVENQR